MNKWKVFLEEKEEVTPLGDLASGVSEKLVRIARMIISEHLKDFVKFAKLIGKKDSTVNAELKAYLRDGSSVVSLRPNETEEVIRSHADDMTPEE